ncbi:MAG: GAF domain-containing protein [Tepidisphaeraceae bacterium]|jgi:PAS domain S-box-containing protein
MNSPETECSNPEPWEAELRRVHRALRVVSAANRALTVASDVVAWLNQVCHTAVDVGDYAMAWVGFAESDEKKLVRPVAQAGFDAGYLQTANITWKDEPHGRGPVGIAVRTGKHCLARDIPNDPAFDPWRNEIVREGYESAIALPLSGGGRTFGVLAMYAKEIDAFSPKEIEVLNELANDLAHGLIVVFRTGVQRQTATEALAESQRNLRRAGRISQLAHWDRDLATDVLTWSDELYRVLGLEPQKRIFRFPEFVQLVHPDDRANVLKAMAEAVPRLGPFHQDYRVIRPDGQMRYIHGEGEVIWDDAGRPCRTVGFLQDVTEQHLAKVALEIANRSLETKNIAMHEILANIETERDKIGQRINKNVEEIILPLLQSVKQGATRQQQRTIDQIDHCLREIISPFIVEMAHSVRNLTPAELRLCSFIKRGLAVKEIAEIEHLSPETIAAHRRNIRRKLQIAHRKINLTSYLRNVLSDSSAASPRGASGSSST